MKDKAWRDFFIIVMLSLTVRVTMCIVLRPYERLSRTELTRISISLASGQGFSNAYGRPDRPRDTVNSGPTAHVPPVYPYILSLVYRTFGTDLGGEIGQYALNVLMASLTFGALPAAAIMLGLPYRTGLYAGLFGAAVPMYFSSEIRGGGCTLVALMLLAATLAFRRTLLQPSSKWLEAGSHGLLWGLVLLTNPSAAPVLPLWIALLIWMHRRTLGTTIRHAAILFGTLAVVLFPWTLRNYQVLGSPIPTRSNLGLELQVSNNDFARASGVENQASKAFDLYHPFASRDQRIQYRKMGEVAYYREKRQQAVAWIFDHPVRFAELTLKRAWFFWTAPPLRPVQMALAYMILVLAAFGLWRLWKVQPMAGMQLASLCFGFSIIYYLSQTLNRYRYPIFWTLLLLAAFGLREMRWWRQVERCVTEWWSRLDLGR